MQRTRKGEGADLANGENGRLVAAARSQSAAEELDRKDMGAAEGIGVFAAQPERPARDE